MNEASTQNSFGSLVHIPYEDNGKENRDVFTEKRLGGGVDPLVRRNYRVRERAKHYRESDSVFAEWAAGYGLIHHDDITQVRIYELANRLVETNRARSREDVYRILKASDRLCSAGMWLVVHQTYAHNVYTDGRTLQKNDFKQKPEGHTGGALNMVPAYMGYMAINALTHETRSWMMGPGHCVSAIDSLNLLLGNMTEAHENRYGWSDEKLTDFVRDFYSYGINADGSPASPLGSHVNANTAGGLSEGGYLGFAELQYVHMPLKGEKLVVFLSDGAFEEQRGSDWAPRWWRAEDSGVVTPILMANGRRIDGRSAIYQNGGIGWLKRHLNVNGFDPVDIDGRDPASFVWAIYEMEDRMEVLRNTVERDQARYPIFLPHGIAEAPKGFGFPGQATNHAHNLPLGTNPFEDTKAKRTFNFGAKRLYVSKEEIAESADLLRNHDQSGRVQEKDHPLAHRNVATPKFPKPVWKNETDVAPMEALDEYFTDIVKANPELRARVGNPDEMRSNRLNTSLDHLKHRVAHPEWGMAEDTHGSVITALNEEAVACAAIGNKGGINLVATYEAFGVKMLGAFRQELIFSRHQKEHGHSPEWLSVPVIMTSHTWENGKNEQSHQDPTFCESMLAEMNDVSRVIFVADANTAIEALRRVYASKGQIWTLVVSKNPVPTVFSPEQAEELYRDGALRLRGSGAENETVQLVAAGGYQLVEMLKASDRLEDQGIAHSLVYVAEPGRFRRGRDAYENEVLASAELRQDLFPTHTRERLFVTHSRPESFMGIFQDYQWGQTRHEYLGYRNRGGTLNVNGMLFANACTWAHVLADLARMQGVSPLTYLNEAESQAVHGQGNPEVLFKG